MSYQIASTEWPSYPVSDATKQLIGSLFATLDDTSSDAGDRLADNIFAIDGVFDGNHPAKGTEGTSQLSSFFLPTKGFSLPVGIISSS
jgi:hypothetical protein